MEMFCASARTTSPSPSARTTTPESTAHFVLDAGGDDRRLSCHKRHCRRCMFAPIRVRGLRRRFRGTGSSRSRWMPSTCAGAYINVVNPLSRSTSTISSRWRQVIRLLIRQPLVARLGCRSDDVVILHVGRQVIDLIGDTAGALLDLLERCDEEAVLRLLFA